MPKKKSVQSLERLCLENVVKNMERVWVKDYNTDDFLNLHHCLYNVGPFSVLVGFLVEELIQLMGERNLLTSAVLHSLLLPQLKDLNLSICPKLVGESVAHIVTMRCKNLSSLDLRSCNQIPAGALVNLVKSLPCLIKLDLSETQCNSQVLSAVGSFCFQLRDLDISACERLTPESLLHLAYNPIARSFCGSSLQILKVCCLESDLATPDLLSALVFVLLALPNLKFLIHDSVAQAVCLIYQQQFDEAWTVSGFPSLKQLARHKMSANLKKESSGLTLDLREIFGVNEISLPMACAVCPHLEEVSFLLKERLDLSQSFLPWSQLVRLTLSCGGRRDLRDLLPVTARLGAQLRTLSIDGFSLEDELSLPMLLTQCQNLHNFKAFFVSPERNGHSWVPENEALDCCISLARLEFLHLCECFVMYSDMEDPLPSQHTIALEKSLINLLRNSPCLEILELNCLPFSMDDVFQKVLAPPGTALQQLSALSLVQDEVSVHTIGLLLSSENKLSYLKLQTCSDIFQTEYEEILQRVRREGLDVHIMWK